MGKLLKFEGPKKPANAGVQIAGDAQILIFTGVRYERGTPSPPSSHNDTRRKRKRV